MRTRSLLTLCGALLLALPGCESELFLTDHGGIEEGNEALANGEAGAALTAYEEAAESVPESAGLNYDRGLALSDLGRHDEATQMLLRSLDTRDPKLKTDVLAALGLAYGRWGLHIERTGAPSQEEALPEGPGVQAEQTSAAEAALPKWERSVEHLEDALAARPADPEVLRNLEVALLRVDPPCASRDDEAEPNDAPGAPHLLDMSAGEEAPQQSMSGAPPSPGQEEASQDELTWKRALLACPDDPEWYAVRLEAGDRLQATLELEDGPSPLGLSLHTPGGARQLRPPEGHDGLLDSLELTTSAQGAGDYLLQVSNPQGDEVAYGLEVVVRPACARVEDHLEDNDTRYDAKDVTPGPIDGLKLCPGDPDWYAVTLAEGESLFVFASPQGQEDEEEDEERSEEPVTPAPALELSLYDAEGNPISEGAPADASRVATLLNPGEGRYLIRVGGPDTLETRYQLLVQVVPPCPDGDDGHEDNDLVEDATDLMALMSPQGGGPGGPGGAGGQGGGGGPPTVLMRICPGDTDWFQMSTDPEAPSILSLVFEHEKGDLAVRLMDASGGELIEEFDVSSPERNGETVPFPSDKEPTPYALEVRGKDGGENFYLLRLDQPQGGDGGDGSEPPEDQEQEEQEPPEDQEQEEQEQEPPEEEQESQTPLEDRLDKLDHNPKNLEALQKALESRRGPPEKDW
ncbi:MAG: hypothetical protein CL940_04185 [Deltaproteobacteria bacterium]|nr:hypothetical protein [Deltaproteobacteria bacterium]